jgi:hypothetical protein
MISSGRNFVNKSNKRIILANLSGGYLQTGDLLPDIFSV